MSYTYINNNNNKDNESIYTPSNVPIKKLGEVSRQNFLTFEIFLRFSHSSVSRITQFREQRCHSLAFTTH